MYFGIWYLNRKALRILLDDLNTTFNFIFFWQVQKILINCYFEEKFHPKILSKWKLLYYLILGQSDILKRHLKQLLILSVKSSCFLFNDVYYKQVDGVAMGSPLGPTLANLFLVYYEHKWLEKCPLQFRPKYYRRYVDDFFLIFESRNHAKKFLKYMNSRHPNIQFTCEEESNDKFLI